MAMLFAPNTYAGEEQVEFGLLDVSLEIDPDVTDFKGNVSIVLDDKLTGQQYQYVFRQSHNYVLPDNPIKVAANTYDVETYIHDAKDFAIVEENGLPIRVITIPTKGAKLVLRVVNSGASETGQAVQTSDVMDISSLIPVMERFYQNTAHAVNGDMVTNLDLWTTGPITEGFLRDPDHTQEQWDNLTVYEKANYLSLTIIPFELIFIWTSTPVNINDKTTFTKPYLSTIEYIRVASEDDELYYNEVCMVIDWVWDYYVQNHIFINVIDEYEKLKTGGTTGIENESSGMDTDGDGAAIESFTLAQDTGPDATVTNMPAAIESETHMQNKQNNIANERQMKLIDKIKSNLMIIFTGVILVSLFLGLRYFNQKRKFQSEERTGWEN